MKDAVFICELLDENSILYQKYNEEEYLTQCKKKIDDIISVTINKIIYSILVRDLVLLDSTYIPIFSNFQDCTNNICVYLDLVNNEGMDILSLGKMFREYMANDVAYYKYGETHAKAAQMLGLVVIKKNEKKSEVFLTNMGYYFLKSEQKNILLTRLLLRTRLIQNLIKNCFYKYYYVKDSMDFLSKTSISRRMPNVKTFVRELSKTSEFNFKTIFANLDYSVEN